MSRHTPLDKGLSRSMPVDLEDHPDCELVIRLEPGGIARVQAEPVNRRLGRNEKLPEITLNLVELFKAGTVKGEDKPSGDLDLTDKVLEKRIDRVLAKLAIAHDGGEKAFYYAKVALMKAVNEEFKHKTNDE